MMRYIINFVFLITSISCFGQNDDLIKLLDAFKTKNHEEYNKILNGCSLVKIDNFIIPFDTDTSEDDLNVKLIDYKDIIDSTFDTDNAKSKIYKAYINCIFQTNGNNFNAKLLIVFCSDYNGQWILLAIREIVYPKYEFDTLKKDISNDKFYSAKEFVYRNLSYWATLAGRFEDARKYIDLAINIAESKNDITYTLDDINCILKRINGK